MRRHLAIAGLGLALLPLLIGATFAARPSVKSHSGSFATAVPAGFTDDTAALLRRRIPVEVAVIGPRSDGFSANINVVRLRTKLTSDLALANASLAALRLAGARTFSTLLVTQLDGQQAYEVDYVISSGPALHERQVYAIDKGWAYTITYTALLGAEYQRSLPALAQIVAAWHWL
jgi:hypothetical protein